MELRTVSRHDPLDAVWEALNVDGAVIVTDFLDSDLLARFRADMEAAATERVAGTRSDNPAVQHFWGANTVRFARLAQRSTAFVEILTDPFYLSIADGVLGPQSVDYWMNTGQMMIIGPGERGQVIHRDADNWRTMCRPDGFEVTLSCMFAITDFTAEAGATVVVPGSHRWDDYRRRPEPHEMCQAVMPAGAGMIYTGRVLHGGGPNTTTDTNRYGLHLSYVLDWLTPEEAGPLSTDWDRVRSLPERAQRLLGWRSSGNRDRFGARLWTVDYEDVPIGLGLID